ncbi:alpha/beta fold hydrolase [Legionella geestiana]|nr:alpha/beta hydrolase [Legionella geestiana]QBS11368.1 alpha/beta hydrolase [Legionella geestiana]
MKHIIHFAHGNGFPSSCYRAMLDGLRKAYTVIDIDQVGHDPRFPVADNWDALALEVLQSVRDQSNEPVIAVGHSLGGVLSLLAAIEEPERFKAIIMLDSPLPGRLKSNVVHIAKVLGLIDRITPAHRTRLRRVHWPTRREAENYLKSRELFRRFAPECLNDYIEFGMQHDENGYSLRFDPGVEYRIFRTIPHILPRHEKALKIPGLLICGSESNVVTPFDRRYMQKYFNIPSVVTKGTHMFPMEHPKLAAQEILTGIDAIFNR